MRDGPFLARGIRNVRILANGIRGRPGQPGQRDWSSKWLSVENLIRFDRSVMAYKILTRGGVLSIFVRRGCAVFQGIVFAHFF